MIYKYTTIMRSIIATCFFLSTAACGANRPSYIQDPLEDKIKKKEQEREAARNKSREEFEKKSKELAELFIKQKEKNKWKH